MIETNKYFLQKGDPAAHGETIGTQSYKISKTGFIIAEPPYYTKIWEYPPQGSASNLFITKSMDTTLVYIQILKLFCIVEFVAEKCIYYSDSGKLGS